MRYVVVTWYCGGLLIGAFGAFMAVPGMVNPKDVFGWTIDPQFSAWVYGMMFGTAIQWLNGK